MPSNHIDAFESYPHRIQEESQVEDETTLTMNGKEFSFQRDVGNETTEEVHVSYMSFQQYVHYINFSPLCTVLSSVLSPTLFSLYWFLEY